MKWFTFGKGEFTCDDRAPNVALFALRSTRTDCVHLSMLGSKTGRECPGEDQRTEPDSFVVKGREREPPIGATTETASNGAILSTKLGRPERKVSSIGIVVKVLAGEN